MEIKDGLHWKKVGQSGFENDRDIYHFQCLICGKQFKRPRNAPAHSKLCLQQKDEIKDQASI